MTNLNNQKSILYSFEMLKKLIILAVLATLCLSNSCEPFGVRIYYGDVVSNPSSAEKVAVFFNTYSQCSKSYIRVITSRGYDRIKCNTETIVPSDYMGGFVAYVQKCSLTRIIFGETFSYSVYGWQNGEGVKPTPYKEEWIQVEITNPTSKHQDVNVAVIADWGPIITKPFIPIIEQLRRIVAEKSITAVIIDGDIAYDLDSNKGANYLQFLALLEKLSTNIPIVHVTGNHEHVSKDAEKLFSQSFKLYGLDTILTAGLSIGSLYLLPYDPFTLVYGREQPISSLDALKLQLQKGVASKRFIIPFSHYPLICSSEYYECNSNRITMNGLFDAMLDSGVSLQVGAHTHAYERNYPYFKNHTFSQLEGPYNASHEYLISVVQGVAGNDRGIMYEMPELQPHTASYTVNQTGFGVISSRKDYISYSHYSTVNGLVDETTIFKKPNTKESKQDKINNLQVSQLLQ